MTGFDNMGQFDEPQVPQTGEAPFQPTPTMGTWETPQNVPDPPRPIPPKKEKRLLPLIAVGLCCSLLGGAVGAGAVMLLDKDGDVSAGGGQTAGAGQDTVTMLEGIREQAVIDIVEVPTDEVMTAAEVYAANVSSTVGITTSVTTNYWGYQSTSAASGSGSIISSDGYILTNFHVIEDSDSITVSTYDGQQYDAKVVGYDESNDIAVLKVEAQGLSPVILGDSDKVNVGDDVVAIGNPLGELTFTLTAGKVSAMDREVTFSNNVTMDLIQTDCAINSGNSGGALFNMYGEMIGVTNAKYSGSSGSGASIDNIGFAIPVNSIRSIVESIIEKGYVAKPYLGVTVSDVSEEYQIYGLPQGAAVQAVAEDSPAQASGLKIGDIITQVDDTEITGADALVELIGEHTAGDVLELTVYRRGETVRLTATIQEKIQSATGDHSPAESRR
ncbi:MAG: trypsin-like peptidase domain-containing protein [Oscillospiraceae bacterium]|nr:trypsin-like peptidase domain-containing protein [Oscillospiraceae bacterium]